MKRKWIAALLAGCMLAALLLTGCSAAETVKRLRFGVAGEGGVYHNFGEQFAALENETSNGTIELRTTAGSAANLRLLTGEYLQLAIAQADLAQDACNQTGIFAEEEDIRGFGAVAALYTEACQVIVRADSDIQSIEDLQGKTVSIGAEESGSEQNALQILSAYGLNDRLVDTINLNYTDAADQLKAGTTPTVRSPSRPALIPARTPTCRPWASKLFCWPAILCPQSRCSSSPNCCSPAGKRWKSSLALHWTLRPTQ